MKWVVLWEFFINYFAESFSNVCLTFLLQWVSNELISLCRLIFVGLRGYVHIGDENIKCVAFLIRYRQWSDS